VYVNLKQNPCNPTPVVQDYDGLLHVERSPLADELQTKYGARAWLAGPRDGAEGTWPPRQDDLAATP
jgi:hypothetical protein